MIALLAPQGLRAQQAGSSTSAQPLVSAVAPGVPASIAAPASAAVPAGVEAPAASVGHGSEETLATSVPARPVAGLHELSPLSMFLSADVVVKAVMVGLMLA